jgi:glycogen(starch) synthase
MVVMWHGRRVRVWLAPSRYAPHLGGIETVVYELAHELQRAGDEVLVITHRDPRNLPCREDVGSVPVRRLRFEAPSRKATAFAAFLRSLPRTARLLGSESRPDLIHVHGAANQLLPLTRYASATGVPVVLTTHGEITGDPHDIFRRSRYMRASLRYGVRRCVAVTAPSRSPLEDVFRLAPQARPLTRVIPNGVRLDVWRSGIPTPPTNLVLAWGRLEVQKGFDRLLAAWPFVTREVPDARLLVAGEGAERGALEGMLTPGVTLLGPLDRQELARHLVDAQIAAVPSRVEAFGMSALEALAAGRPVIHSGLPALRDLVGAHGWSADHDDPWRLGRSIAQALCEAPRTVPGSAVEQFDWMAVLRSYRALYADIVE